MGGANSTGRSSQMRCNLGGGVKLTVSVSVRGGRGVCGKGRGHLRGRSGEVRGMSSGPRPDPPHALFLSSPRDSAYSHSLPHGQSLSRVHRLRHQQHWPHPPTEDNSGLRFWHLLHPVR